MSDLKAFLNSRILRSPITWIVAVLGGVYGGLDMYGRREAQRAAGAKLSFSSLWMERSFEVLFGASIQVVYLLCAVWLVVGLMEDSKAWIRQLTVIALYLGINWLTQFL